MAFHLHQLPRRQCGVFSRRLSSSARGGFFNASCLGHHTGMTGVHHEQELLDLSTTKYVLKRTNPYAIFVGLLFWSINTQKIPVLSFFNTVAGKVNQLVIGLKLSFEGADDTFKLLDGRVGVRIHLVKAQLFRESLRNSLGISNRTTKTSVMQVVIVTNNHRNRATIHLCELFLLHVQVYRALGFGFRIGKSRTVKKGIA